MQTQKIDVDIMQARLDRNEKVNYRGTTLTIDNIDRDRDRLYLSISDLTISDEHEIFTITEENILSRSNSRKTTTAEKYLRELAKEISER